MRSSFFHVKLTKKLVKLRYIRYLMLYLMSLRLYWINGASCSSRIWYVESMFIEIPSAKLISYVLHFECITSHWYFNVVVQTSVRKIIKKVIWIYIESREKDMTFMIIKLGDERHFPEILERELAEFDVRIFWNEAKLIEPHMICHLWSWIECVPIIISIVGCLQFNFLFRIVEYIPLSVTLIESDIGL